MFSELTQWENDRKSLLQLIFLLLNDSLIAKFAIFSMLLSITMSFHTVIEKYRDSAFSKSALGNRFERLIQSFLQTMDKSCNVLSKDPNPRNKDSMSQIGAPLTDFSEDKLNLGPFADGLTNIVVSQLPHPTNEHSKVIALDSGWGTGKTSFINMWTKKLETDTNTKSKFICLKYNAWEHDDSPDALVPIIYALLPRCPWRRIKTHICLRLLAIPEYASIILSIAFGIVIVLFGVCILKVDPNKFGVFLTAVSVAMVMVKVMMNRLCMNYFARRDRKALFKELINGIRGNAEYLIICIDELDRCRPTFAIETLEVVKHFFDIPNVVFVFSLDMQQLSKSIKTIYGDIDSMSYLQKFFDYIIPLPMPPTLDSFLGDRLQYPAEIDLLSRLAKRFSISLRTLNVICVVYSQFVTTRNSPEWVLRKHMSDWYYLEIYLLFITMKYSHPEMYWSLLRNGSSEELGREILGFIKEKYGNGINWPNMYTKKSANLTRANTDADEWEEMIDLFSLFNEEDVISNRDDIPIYSLIDKNIESGLLKAKKIKSKGDETPQLILKR